MFSFNLRSIPHWRTLLISATTCSIVLWFGLKVPGLALSAQFAPIKPRLGETIVVTLLTSPGKKTTPTIKLGDKSYPAFPISTGKFRAMIPTTPLEKPGERVVNITDNPDQTTLKVAVASREFKLQYINLPPGKSGNDATEMELKRVAAFKTTVTPNKLWDGQFIAPNKGRTSSPYGVRRKYNGKLAEDYYHRGLDYAGGYGSAVVAPAGGEVVLVGYEKDGFKVHGNVVGVNHGQGLVSIFMHMSKITVEEGDTISPGDQIGAIGTTGASTGPHLHWGLYANGVSVDPVQWLKTSID